MKTLSTSISLYRAGLRVIGQRRQLSTPTSTFPNIPKSIAENLSTRFKITSPNDAQTALIPPALSGRDIVFRSITGSGKSITLVAIAASKLEKKQPSSQPNHVQTVLLSPTRELAVQLYQWTTQLLEHHDADYIKKHVQVILNGLDRTEQTSRLQKSTPSILIGTPLRILELVDDGVLDLSKVETLVLDEVDYLIREASPKASVREKFRNTIHPKPSETLVQKIVHLRRPELIENEQPITPKSQSPKMPSMPKKPVVAVAQSRTPFQIIATSATLPAFLYESLVKRRKWLKNPLLLDMTSTGETSPPNISHHVLTVREDGTTRDLYDSSQEDALPIDELEMALPDADDLVIDAVVDIIKRDNIQSAMLFVSSSVALGPILDKLNAAGIPSDKLIRQVEWSDFGIEVHATARDSEPQKEAGTVEGTMSSTTKAAVVSDTTAKTAPFASFTSGDNIRVLVATEHAARGLDMPNISHVFILGPPISPTSYFHMAGRTGRFGRRGTVITVLSGRRYSERVLKMLKSLQLSTGMLKKV
ncbi:hypothetical protein SmJEL517_g02441 [Synchytrium microbalum]|uniref:RNA helicase n=1 Tax=Synchytrium microbalum TaxID=1806994 RepID=A0A507C0F8_9FUNG|nr:uncharacterized protein SmJEL517_g02441 [Synchytrium microbalum]TPX35020.1 hypothetical protein SmJEL517_g02441 [Synchytrium microbalum]